nr:hypothetical protein HK105_005683 [Polyrhizophydium stewartii]
MSAAFPPDQFDDEVEVMPGVYLIKRKPKAPAAASADAAAAAAAIGMAPGTQPGGVMYGEVTLSDNVEFLNQERDRLSHSIKLLVKSNQELREADPNDPDFTEPGFADLSAAGGHMQAIAENVKVIEKRLLMIETIDRRIRELIGADVHRCGSEAAGPRHPAQEAQKQQQQPSREPQAHNQEQRQTEAEDADDQGGVFL